MLTWGLDEGKLKRKDNPASNMAKNLPRKRKGERVLSPDEIRIAWRAAATLGYPFGPVYQKMMLTGDRRGAWGKAKRSQIDLRLDSQSRKILLHENRLSFLAISG